MEKLEEHYKNELNKSNEYYSDFVNKVIFYSAGILATSISGFITLFEKLNIKDLKLYFSLIVFFSGMSIFLGLILIFIKSKIYFQSYEVILNLGKFYLPGNNGEKILEKDSELSNKKNCFVLLEKTIFYIFLISFILSIIFVIVLFTKIDPVENTQKADDFTKIICLFKCN